MAKEKKKIATSRREHADEAAETEGVSKFEKQERSAAAMLEFLEKARKGEFLPADIIIQFASHFHDDLTLDNMPRMQLINMCRYMNIPPYGSDNFLRFQLRHKIRSLVDDDQRILWEGIDSLTKMELREACQERGMRSTGLSKDAYKSALQQWLDLSVNKHVPISLLIMSRSFFLREEMTARGPPEESNSQAVAGLADAISGLDQDIVNEVVLEVATSEEKKSDPAIRKIKLEVLEAQNERILEEQLEREAASKKKEKELQKEETPEVEVKAKSADDVQAPPAAGMEDISADDSASVAKETEKTETKKTETKESEEDYLSTEEMDALSQLISKNPVNREREELERIKAAIADRKKEDVDIEKIKATMMSENTEDSSLAWGDGEKVYSSSAMERVSGKIYVKPEPLTQEEVEQAAKEVISKMDAASAAEADASTTTQPDDASAIVAAEAETHEVDHRLDRTIESLKARVSQMVDKIESQLESVEEKIGDKLHFLDKDGDGMLTLSEMADALQSVLKRKISHEEAMAIADLMVSGSLISLESFDCCVLTLHCA
jgi:LETM1 and EF-hand domain-containing protein 1